MADNQSDQEDAITRLDYSAEEKKCLIEAYDNGMKSKKDVTVEKMNSLIMPARDVPLTAKQIKSWVNNHHSKQVRLHGHSARVSDPPAIHSGDHMFRNFMRSENEMINEEVRKSNYVFER